MGALDGWHALVTGGGTGIGAAIARALAAGGRRGVACRAPKAPLDDVARSLPKATAIIADVTSAADCEAMVAAARAAHGPIDIVIANAGAAESAPAAKISAEHWQRMIGVNLTGAFFTVQAALRDVTRKGDGTRPHRVHRLDRGLKGYPYVAAYCAAKHGVVGLRARFGGRTQGRRADRERGVSGLHRYAAAGCRGRRGCRQDRALCRRGAHRARQGQRRWPVDFAGRGRRKGPVAVLAGGRMQSTAKRSSLPGTRHDDRGQVEATADDAAAEQAKAAALDPHLARRARDRSRGARTAACRSST